MKTILIAVLVGFSLAVPLAAAAEAQGKPNVNSIEGIEANGESKVLESGLTNATRAVVEWWNEHGAGFQSYPFRAPSGKWRQRKAAADVREFEEIEGQQRFRWMASFGQATGNRWKLFYWCNEPYVFTWTVDVSGDQAKIVEVKIDSPIPDWVDLSTLR